MPDTPTSIFAAMKNDKLTLVKTALSSFLFSLAVLLTACTGSSHIGQELETGSVQADSEDAVYSIFLIGDAGAASLEPRASVLKTMQEQMMKAGEKSAVIFLGDNVYPDGLPPEGAPSRDQAEDRLLSQLKTVEDYPGRIVFIPGNHDWYSSGKEGLEWIRRQEQYVESYLDRGNTFMPDSGYPGPVSISLQKSNYDSLSLDIRLLVLDTQWWLHAHEKPIAMGLKNEEEQKDKILSDMNELIKNHREDEIILATHHPLFSYGRHGGKFPRSTHFLPPVFGSMYVAYRNIWGYAQDIANYSDLKKGLLKSFEFTDELVHASGHEHSLQFIPQEEGESRQYYLVSGSASKPSYVRKKSNDVFTREGEGFVVLRYYKDRSKSVEFWDYEGNRVFNRQLPKREMPASVN